MNQRSFRLSTFASAALVAATLLAGCAPQQPAVEPTAPSLDADLAPGTHVHVARQGQWYPATIVQPLGDGRFVIHYDNAGNEWNEPVGMDRIRTGATSAPAKDYRTGEKVLVTAQGRQMLAEVTVQLATEQWRVHFDGYGADVVETVGPDRMRRPFTGVSTHAIGESLLVDVNGTVLPAKVIAVAAPDKWLVRFDGFAPQYDQEVTVERLRAAPVAPPAPVAVAPPPPAPPEKIDNKKKPAKAAPVAAAAPVVASGPPAAGDAVLVSVRGGFVPATVTAVAGGAFKIKFTGAGGGEEEVAADRLHRDAQLPKGSRYAANQPVFVEYHGIFVHGKVVKEDATKGTYKIRFDGQGPESDELVLVKRLRPR